jgi:hypothetical protein
MTSYSAIYDVYNEENESNNLDAMAREINDNKRRHKLIKNTYNNLYEESKKNKKKLRELKDPDNLVGRFMPSHNNDSEISLNSEDRFNKGFTLINDIKNSISNTSSRKNSISENDSFLKDINNYSSNSSIINDISIKSPEISESSESIKIKKKNNKRKSKDKYIELIKNMHPDDDSISQDHSLSSDGNYAFKHIKNCRKCKKKMKEILKDNTSSESEKYNKVNLPPKFNPPEFIYQNQNKEEDLIFGFNKKQLKDLFIIIFFVLIIVLMIFLIIRLMR